MVITHYTAIAGMADRVLRLGGGRIVGSDLSPRRLSPEELSWNAIRANVEMKARHDGTL